jgi:YhcN/YlaJ family sporulation lipoprotein
MRQSRSLLLMVALMLLFSLFFATASCSPARRPLPRTKTTTPAPVPRTATPEPAPGPNTTTPAPGTAQRPLPSDSDDMGRLIKRLDAEAAKVSGVTRATTIVSGSTAYVGLQTKPNVNTTAVKTEVAKRLRQAEPRLESVKVTTSPDLVARIKEVSQGVVKGAPLSSFRTEITEIIRRMTTTT